MSDKKIKSMVMAAVMAALTYVATTVIKIPAPTGGYVHIGDGLVLLCGWILGPWWGGAAAGIGSMLVDLLGGAARTRQPIRIWPLRYVLQPELTVSEIKLSHRKKCRKMSMN